MKHRYIAGAAAFSLLFYEIAETKEPAKFLRAPYTGIDATESTLAPCNHTHSELRIESYANVTNVLAASGASGLAGLECYALHLLPVFSQEDGSGGRTIARIELIGFSNIGGQQMHGKFDSLEYLALLAEKLYLSKSHVRSIRNSLLAGNHCEVGGRVSALTFQAKSLRSIGMSFRPPA